MPNEFTSTSRPCTDLKRIMLRFRLFWYGFEAVYGTHGGISGTESLKGQQGLYDRTHHERFIIITTFLNLGMQ